MELPVVAARTKKQADTPILAPNRANGIRRRGDAKKICMSVAKYQDMTKHCKICYGLIKVYHLGLFDIVIQI